MRRRLCFIVESGTDVRMVDGLAERFDLRVWARRIEGGVEISRAPKVPVPVEIGAASRFGFAKYVRRRLKEYPGAFDAILVQGYSAAALAAHWVLRGSGIPVWMLVCSPLEAYYRCRQRAAYPGKPYRSLELAGLKRLARWNAQLGGRYVVLSQHLADLVRSHGPAKQVEIIPVYGVDTSVFRPRDEPRSALRRRLGLPEAQRLLFFSSRIAPEKDTETLLEALRMLTDAGQDFRILNRSGGHALFADRARKAGVGDRIVATDAVHPQEGLADDYRACDLCVQASREEGLGFSPLEALACATPVVAADVGGLRETIREGETGWTYPPGDARALATAIQAALDDPQETARRTANGRRMVEAHYDCRRCFDRLAVVLGANSRTSRP